MILKTAGIFIFDKSDRLLICRATGQDHWSIPKGHVDANESIINAAIRETFEETGMDLSPFKHHMKKIEPVKYRSKKKELHSFIIHLQTNINVTALHCDSLIDESETPEIDKYELVTVKKAITKIHETQVKILKDIYENI